MLFVSFVFKKVLRVKKVERVLKVSARFIEPFVSFVQLFAVLYLFSGAHHPFGGRVQKKIRVQNKLFAFKIAPS